MSQNKLQYLPLHVFYGKVDLEILTMSRNKLQDLPLHVFFRTVSLEILNMSQNQLQDLPLHVFYGTVYLEILNVLNVSQNKLQDLPLISLSLSLSLSLSFRAYRHHHRPMPGTNRSGHLDLSGCRVTHCWTSVLSTLDPQHRFLYQMPVSHYLRERTVHTIYFKIWEPDTPHRSLYIEEIKTNMDNTGNPNQSISFTS